jgi:diguanylate cyclase (GGDEF)-like protein
LLCQRIGSALAEAADLLITQAFAREQLAAERDVLHRLSRTDALTGLGNRIAWEEAAEGCRSGCPDEGSVIISADLDGLKGVNDRLGHPVGDAVIRAAANLLRASVRDGDVVTRVGGDEFLILCRDADAVTARQIASRIARARRRWLISDHGITPEISVGWAFVSGGDVGVAVALADSRMYAAKRRRASRLAIGRDRRTRL